MQYINGFPVLIIILSLTFYLPIRYIIVKRKEHRVNYYKEIVYILLIAYGESVVYLTVFPSPGANPSGEVSVNLIPFQTINRYFAFQGNAAIPIINLLGNVVVFIPIGLFAVFLNKKLSFMGAFLIGFSCSLSIEITQLILSFLKILSRSFDIDDIILNTLGVLLGFIIIKLILSLNNLIRNVPLIKK
ncbi:VanZ family protein [Ornithinibacillus salinisoli]|uniref:VanZ family protein n=1 Tax=Ornithinibacillus salinisoli TaxID=1848459 RepID=A0ABW4VZX6_9BACI